MGGLAHNVDTAFDGDASGYSEVHCDAGGLLSELPAMSNCVRVSGTPLFRDLGYETDREAP